MIDFSWVINVFITSETIFNPSISNPESISSKIDNFESNVIIQKSSNETACVCSICKIASTFDGAFIKSNQPKKTGPKKSSNVKSEEKKLCDDCLSVYAPGFNHVCNDHTTLENLKRFHERKPIVAEAFAAYIIKNKDSSPKGTRRLSVLHGPKLPVTIGSSNSDKELISHEKVIEFQRETNLSQNQTRKLQTFLNKNEAKVVKGLKEELVRQNHILDDQHHIIKKFFL